MKIDDSIAGDFVRGDITAKAFRSYLAQFLHEEPSSVPASFGEECRVLLSEAEIGQFRVDDWERVFLMDNVDNAAPSTAQLNRLEKISRRHRRQAKP